MKKGVNSIMKSRKAAALAAILAASVLMTACGGKEYLKDIKASDYVTLGNYLGIGASADEPTVQDGEVDAYMSYYVLPQIPVEEVTDRAVQDGDTVNIDFAGYLDGVAFDGGTGAGYDLKIGSHSFIDGFEDGLIGVNYGDTVSLDLTFPDPYINPDLAGAAVVFEVTVNGRKDVDSFAQSLGIEGCSTEEELREVVYNALYDNAVAIYENTIETILTNTIMSNCVFKEPPAKMVERFEQRIEEERTATAAQYGMTLGNYMLASQGMDETAYKELFKTEAITRAQQYIMYQAIADAEGLNPTDEQLQEEIDASVAFYGYESEAAFKEDNDMEALKEGLMRRNVVEFLKENGNITTIPAGTN